MIRGLEPAATAEDLLALYDNQVQDVYGFILRRCGDKRLAEDMTQDVFLAVAERFRQAEELPTPAWLYRFARSRLIDHWRREERRVRKLRLVAAADGDRHAADHVEHVLRAQRVNAALDRLPPDHRAVLMLRYLDDLPVKDIAEAIGRSPRATESLLARARRNLETNFRRQDGE